MQHNTITQDFTLYTNEDHKTWRILYDRQIQLNNDKVSNEYLEGFRRLQINGDSIINIGEMSSLLYKITGWKLVPVTGLIPPRDFFFMLSNNRYPININIRKQSELDFSEQPDIFHDVCGHIPLLTNDKFVKFLHAYSAISLKYVNNEKAVDLLSRVYWFTYEMGLINENGTIKPYGGAIITSAEEIKNVQNDAIPKHGFDLDMILTSTYNPFDLQKQYFVIDSFDDLFACLEYLESKLIDKLLVPPGELVLINYTSNPAVAGNSNDVIRFLNDIQMKFPDAISFAAGQPDENFFNVTGHFEKFNVFVDYLANLKDISVESAINNIGQYNTTKGIINDLVSRYLANDENINVGADEILITVGAQEAFAVIVSSICDRVNDIILLEDPSYIGLSSFAGTFGYSIAGVDVNVEGINLEQLERTLIEMKVAGKRVKLLYVIPDYQNPSGACMPIGNRLKLIELAHTYNFLIIEDSVYNSFTYLDRKIPCLKSLDRYNRVIYVTSFSKFLFPGIRLGVIAANQLIQNGQGELVKLIDIMTKVKAQITNNTSTVSQAIVGGVLLDQHFTLKNWNAPKIESYKRKRDHLADCLNKCFNSSEHEWAENIHWDIPDGGFFVKVNLGIPVDNNSVYECARKHKVIFSPMRYFHIKEGGETEIRLAFSNLSLTEIEQGIQRLFEYIHEKIKQQKPALIDQ